MIYIAHRGNITGPNPELENSVEYIQRALDQGYDCEIDVWFDEERGWFLGHDYPQYEIDFSFLLTERLWIHCKNINALYKLTNHIQLTYFWHQEDDYTLTSKNQIWCYPGKEMLHQERWRGVAVMPELHNLDVSGYGGICSDYVGRYRND